MQEFLDYIHYLLSYLQFGSFRDHLIGVPFFWTTYLLVIVIFKGYWKLFWDANDQISADLTNRLSNEYFGKFLLFGISLVLLSGILFGYLFAPRSFH